MDLSHLRDVLMTRKRGRPRSITASDVITKKEPGPPPTGERQVFVLTYLEADTPSQRTKDFMSLKEAILGWKQSPQGLMIVPGHKAGRDYHTATIKVHRDYEPEEDYYLLLDDLIFSLCSQVQLYHITTEKELEERAYARKHRKPIVADD